MDHLPYDARALLGLAFMIAAAIASLPERPAVAAPATSGNAAVANFPGPATPARP